MLEFWGMQSTSLLPSLPGPLWLGVVAPDRVRSMGQIQSFTFYDFFPLVAQLAGSAEYTDWISAEG